ncbi:uncharacterized protein [Typha latifolia]|uniref:uncharacterized protein n=1 Tax=Typha latifolia TaxID=4733 RepID=UPI003C2F248E
MTLPRIPLSSNMQRPRVNHSPGWAAFNRKQRSKDSTGIEGEDDPFPSISGIAGENLASNKTMKSFSSVVRTSLEFPLLVNNDKGKTLIDDPGMKRLDNHAGFETNIDPVAKLLMDVHSWADANLINDILAAVNNDFDQASALLKAMVSPDSETREASLSGESSSNNDKERCSAEGTSVEHELLDGESKLSISMRRIFSVPPEPEWQEDDVYLSHRKDAIKMMRAASQHSRAASNAFLRGDHLSAHQLSQRAQEEWIAAEKLNRKAAEEILHLRNFNNDIWKLDLHGLHASEAASALKEHLHKIENQTVFDRSSSDGLSKLDISSVRLPSIKSIKCSEVEFATRKVAVIQQKQAVLHVITGSGNHSKEQASLPMVVKSFLIENGYRFDEARPGVIAVRPKFRHKKTLNSYD